MFMADSPEFVAVFLAAMRIGAVPVPVSTMSRADGLAELLRDSRARLLAVSPRVRRPRRRRPLRPRPELRGILAAGTGADARCRCTRSTNCPASDGCGATPPTTTPRVLALHLRHHRHAEGGHAPARLGPGRLRDVRRRRCSASARTTAACPRPRRSSRTGWATRCCSRCRSGAAAVLEPAPSRPDALVERAQEVRRDAVLRRPDVLRQHAARAAAGRRAGRRAAGRVSAGEALPAALYQRWTGHFGVDILDGIGMTEMLHIFLSNRPGEVRARHHRRRRARLRPADPRRRRRARSTPGVPGTLFVRGDSTATGYWSRYAASRQVFQGEWLRTGDTYVAGRRRLLHLPRPHRRHAQGQRHLGRRRPRWRTGCSPTTRSRRPSWSPRTDADGLEKPVAYVVLRDGRRGRPRTS